MPPSGEPSSSPMCRLCAVQLNENSAMYVFSRNALRYDASGLILKYFELEIQSTDLHSKFICPSCWTITSNFHELYKRVHQSKHRWDLRSGSDPLRNGDDKDANPIFSTIVQDEADIKFSDNEDDQTHDDNFHESNQASLEGDNDDIEIDNKETDARLADAVASVDNKEAQSVGQQAAENKGGSRKNAVIKLDCDICGKFFANPYVLATHVRMIHEKVPDQMCHVCARTFKSKHVLEMHQRVHAEQDPPRVQCNICGNWLKHEQSLRMHMELHTQSTAQTCHLCDKVLSSKRAMGNHMRYMHSGRLYKCTMCEKSFKMPLKLKEHFAAIHTGEDLYTCLYCPKAFKSGSSMYKHMRKRHWEEWSQVTRHRRVQQHNVDHQATDIKDTEESY